MIEVLSALRELENHHRANCQRYGVFAKQEFLEWPIALGLKDFHFLAVAAFKNYPMKSVSSPEVSRVLSSSVTSVKKPEICLDKTTARCQVENLGKSLVKEFGEARSRMVFVHGDDHASPDFSASKAAINGFSIMTRASLTIPSDYRSGV
jgi:hypothetical protein